MKFTVLVLLCVVTLSFAADLLPTRQTKSKHHSLLRNLVRGQDACSSNPCGSDETCCIAPGGEAACCPAEGACCCPDQAHCCSSGYKCVCSGTCPGSGCSCTGCSSSGFFFLIRYPSCWPCDGAAGAARSVSRDVLHGNSPPPRFSDCRSLAVSLPPLLSHTAQSPSRQARRAAVRMTHCPSTPRRRLPQCPPTC